MADIVSRLRDLPYRPLVDHGNGDVRDELDPDIAEAANEIEHLREELGRLRDEVELWKDRHAAELQAHEETMKQADDAINEYRCDIRC